jgi:hypothetical protein
MLEKTPFVNNLIIIHIFAINVLEIIFFQEIFQIIVYVLTDISKIQREIVKVKHFTKFQKKKKKFNFYNY